jgi:hypothetical protein
LSEPRLERLKILYRYGTLSAPMVARCIEAILSRHQIPSTGFDLFGQGVDLGAIPSVVKKKGLRGFDLAGHGFGFLLASLPQFRLDFFSVEAASKIPWDEWVGELAGNPDFVMAWIVDVEYDRWQNAKDPLLFKAAGRPYEHLPMTSNGLPPPLQKEVIDTSRNPGRWSFDRGWIEAVGAVMWLGEPFWPLTRANRRAVESADGLRVSHPIASVTRIQSADRSFTSAGAESGRLQDRVRALLFPGSPARSPHQ